LARKRISARRRSLIPAANSSIVTVTIAMKACRKRRLSLRVPRANGPMFRAVLTTAIPATRNVAVALPRC